jgi:ABC-type uncharacterized transport system permease subunit
MTETLISFETAKLVKEKSFNEACVWYFTPELIEYGFKIPLKNSELGEFYSAPTQSLLQKWLREVHNIHISIKIYTYINFNKIKHQFSIRNLNNKITYSKTIYSISTYEEALEEALFESLKLIKI